MRAYLPYLLRRLGQFVLVVFIGINIAFVMTHATPIDPVEQTISAATSFGSTSPEAIAKMRESLRELYGVQGGLGAQYVAFWRRVAVGDFGPSLSAFPTPVSVLIARALPWTAGLLVTATLIAWCARQPARRARRLLPRQPLPARRRAARDGRCIRCPTTSSPSCC